MFARDARQYASGSTVQWFNGSRVRLNVLNSLNILNLERSMEPRLEQYLAEQQLTAQTLQVMPLTGDASDRRYYRVLLKDAPPIVLALHAGPIEYASMPFVSIASLLAE